MNILEKIIAHKRKEVDQRKKEVEVKELEIRTVFFEKGIFIKAIHSWTNKDW